MTTNENKIFTAQQPILDKNIEIFGYEFFSRSSMQDQKSTIVHTDKSDTKALFDLFSNFDLEYLLKGKKAFLNCVLESNEALNYFDLLPPNNVVIEVQPPKDIDDVEAINLIAERMKELKTRGYVLACSEIVFQKNYENWLGLLSFIKFANIKAEKLSTEELKELIEKIQKAKQLNIKIVAEKVETLAEFDILKKLNFDYYQGYFFSKPVNLSVKVNNPSMITLVKLVNLVIAEEEFKEIEKVLKTDTAISFKLLRYLNSYGVGGGQKVETFNRALMILGYKKLLKWLSILFTSVEKKQGSDAVSKMALIRARFMETMALEFDKKDADAYFMVGLFSMLEALLGVKIDVALNSINVAEEVKNAVLNRQGKYAEMLHVAEMLEKNDWIEILSTLYKLNIPTDIMNEKYLETIKWVNELNI